MDDCITRISSSLNGWAWFCPTFFRSRRLVYRIGDSFDKGVLDEVILHLG